MPAPITGTLKGKEGSGRVGEGSVAGDKVGAKGRGWLLA